MMTCPSKCRPLNRPSIGLNRCIPHHRPGEGAFAPEPSVSIGAESQKVNAVPFNTFSVFRFARRYPSGDLGVATPAQCAPALFQTVEVDRGGPRPAHRKK
jgi:hypothetical protein